MWSGFSSYQLVYGQQPKLPSTSTDRPPALHGSSSSTAVVQHINTMHAARKAFIEAESAERVRRALRHKLRSCSINLQQGDRVFYKRQDSNKWRGPGIVIGRDGKVIFVRHGSVYVRVSMNRILKAGEEFTVDDSNYNPKEKANPSYQSHLQITSHLIGEKNQMRNPQSHQ